MTDIVSKAKRSAMMRAVKQKRTAPELAVGKLLREAGFRYRLNHPALPGRPDFANRTRGWAIFVHGCFWHGHADCARQSSRKPKSNTEYWTRKITDNRARDSRKERGLIEIGVRVLTVWECEIRDAERLRSKLLRFLDATE